MKKHALANVHAVRLIMVVMAFCLTGGVSHATGSTFTSTWTSSETDASRYVSVGDLDGDGDPDMAACGGGSATAEPMRVYRNDGGNAFSLLWSSTENLNCWEVKMGDSDNDGDLDLLTANDASSPNRLYTNDGTGSFTLAWSDTDSDNTASVAWGDYDRDGDLDFWAGNQSGVPDRLYRNDGGNVFVVAFTSPDTDSTESLAWGDVDGDGDPDMLVGNTGAARILYRNDGNDVFTNAWASTEVDSLTGVTLADMDNDGDLDLVTVGDAVNARVYAGDGGGGFALQWSSPGALAFRNVAVGDTNADGLLDIVVAVDAGANVLYINNGSLTFTSDWTSAENDATTGVALADSDGDGDMDIFVSNYNQANRVYVNGDNPTNTAPTPPTLIPVGGGVSGSVPIMWAGDSTDDHSTGPATTYNLRVGTFPGGNDVMSGVSPAGPGNVGQALSHALVLSAGAGTQTYYWSVQAVDGSGFLTSSFATEDSFMVSGAPPPNAYSLAFTSSEMDTSQAMAVADLDNDGDNDIALAVSGAAKRVYSNDGGLAFTSAWTSTETNDSNHVDVGDYDNDGLLDLLFGNGTGQADQLYHNNGGLAFSLAWTSTVAANTNGVKLADMNNDGFLDVVSAGDTDLNIYYGDGQGGFSAASQVITGGTAQKGLAVGDVSGDGRVDIVLADTGAARRAYLNNGNGSFGLNWTSSETEQNEGLKLGDYDGDGDLDLLAAVPTGNNRLYQNDGTGTFTSVWTSPNVFDYRNVDFADFNADGALDLAQVADVGGAVEVFSNAGMDNFIQDWASAETGEFYAVAFADMDGDNDVDLVAKATGEPLYVYENTLNPPNTPPGMIGLTPEPDGVSGSVTLDWSPATDDLTPPGQLTYNLRVGLTPGGSEIVSPASAAGPGNMGQAVAHTLNLSDGGSTLTYYWSVQAVDTVGYARSTFLAEDSFTLGSGGGGGDTTGPTSGAISYTGGVTSAASVALTLTPATDTSGMASSAFIYRVEALYDGMACGNFTPAAQLAEISSTDTTYTDTTIAPGMCYQYQYKTLDTLSNFTVFTNVAVVQVDPGMSGSQPLAAPTNFVVSNVTTTTANLSWNAVQDAVTYGVSVVNVSTQAEVVSTSVTAPTTSYALTGLSPGVSYSALVVALDANTAPGLPPLPVDFTTQAAPPPLAAPANPSVSNVLTSSVVLTWDAVQNAVAYGVKVIDVATSAVVVSTSVTAPTTSYNAAGLTHNTSYSVVLTAIDANNAAGTPGAALLFHTLEQNWASVSDITHNSVTVNWQNITTVAAGQIVGFVFTPGSSGNPEGISIIPGATGNTSILSDNLTELAPETQYTVLVFAAADIASVQNQQYLSVSQPVVFTTLAGPPPLAAPANPSVSNVLTSSADLSWDAVQDAVAYGVSVVDVATNAEVVSTSVTAPTTSYTAAGLTHNTSYSVVLTAIDANNAAGTPGAALVFHTLEQNWASVSNITHNSVTVNWQNITTVAAGQIVGFVFTPGSSGNPEGISIIPGATGNTSILSDNLTELAPETQYTVLVFAAADIASVQNQQYLSVSQPVVFTTLAAPPPPGTLTLEGINGVSVNLSWIPVADAVAYHIHIGSSGTPPEPDFTVTAPTTTLTVPCLWAGTSYNATLAYTDAGGVKHDGVSSLSINMPSRSGNVYCPLEAPKKLEAGAVTERSATLSWRSVNLAREYRVEKKLSSDTDWEAPTTVRATEFALTCLDAGFTYDFRVSAVDENGTPGDPAQISQTMLPNATNNRGCPAEQPTPTQAQVSLTVYFPTITTEVFEPCNLCLALHGLAESLELKIRPEEVDIASIVTRVRSQAQTVTAITVERPGPEGGIVPVFINLEEGTYSLRAESRDAAGNVVGVAVTTINAEAGTQVVPTLVSGVEYTGAGFTPNALSLRTGESLVIRNNSEATGAFAVAGLAGCEATLAPSGVLACTVRQAGDFTLTGPGPNFTAQVTVTQNADFLAQARPSLGAERSVGATNTGAFAANLLVNNGGAGLPVGAAIDPGNGEDAIPVSAEGPVAVTYAPGSYTALLLDANEDVLARVSVTVAEGEPAVEPPAPSGEVVAGFEEVQLGLVTPGTYTVQGVQTVSVSGSGPIYNVGMPALDDFYLESELDDGNNDGATRHTFPIVIEPATIPTLNGGETRSILFKVRVPIGTPPGNYRAGKGVVSDNNNNQQFDPGDSYDIFQVKLTVADFAAQGATCPAHELLQVGENTSETPPQPVSASRNAAWEVTP